MTDTTRSRRPLGTAARICAAIALGFVVIACHLWLTGARFAGSTSAPRSTSLTPGVSTQEAMLALTGPAHRRTLALLPANFSPVMGYRPIMVAGYPINPGGGCSSPVPLPHRFDILCQSHDFGYDLLRYADRMGNPLGPWARVALDRVLIDRMRASCTDAPCVAAAELSRAGLAANTWRQAAGPPVASESPLTIGASIVTRLVSTYAQTPKEQQ